MRVRVRDFRFSKRWYASIQATVAAHTEVAWQEVTLDRSTSRGFRDQSAPMLAIRIFGGAARTTHDRSVAGLVGTTVLKTVV